MTVARPTFEAVQSAQSKLRKMLDMLIEQKRPIANETERETLLKILNYATLGLGTEQLVTLYSEKGSLIRSNVEVYSRWLVYQKNPVVNVPFILYGQDSKMQIPIEKLWILLRDNLHFVYPIALQKSVRLSKEIDSQQKSGGYMVEEDKDYD